MPEKIRTPIQKRSIDKKKRIIKAGYALFAKKGYYNTNTAEIAKVAEVSTGIVYGYFHDKRDILLEVMDIYIDKVFNPILKLLDTITTPIDWDFLLSSAIDNVLKMHKRNAAIHETLHAFSHTDEAVRLKFISLEDEITAKLSEKLTNCGVSKEGLKEKIHISIKAIEFYAHECVYDKHEYINYSAMRMILLHMLKQMFVSDISLETLTEE